MKKALIFLSLVLLLLLSGCERGPKDLWFEELPWDAEWTCLLLGDRDPGWELEPESGKDGVRTLLRSRRWLPAEAAEEDGPPFRLIRIWTGEDDPLTLTLNEQGEVCWNGSWHRPQGEGAGEKLLADFLALADTGVNMTSPPPLILRCGDAEAKALLYGTYSWSYRPRSGQGFGCMSDAFYDPYSVDWADTPFSFGPALLRADGEVTLSFPGSRMPDSMRISLRTAYGTIPVELQEGRFIPYAGVNVYFLSAHWEEPHIMQGQAGGGGDALYVLLAEGTCPREAPKGNADAELALVSADAWGCDLILTAGERSFNIGSDRSWDPLPTHHLLRRTDFGSWEPVKGILPVRGENPRLTFPAGEAVSFRLDWSRELGSLEPGEYCLMLCGYYSSSPIAISHYISLCFSLEDRLPEPPGPLSLQALPEGIGSELVGHRIQTLTLTGEEKYAVDRDFSLFRLTGSGDLTCVRPAHALPAVLNQGAVLSPKADRIELDIDPAAAYGDLEPGDYVLRRRLLRLEKGERSWDWRVSPPEDRLVYVDAVFTLGTGLAAVSGRVEPVLPSPRYDRRDPALPLRITLGEDGIFDDVRCRFTVKNLGEREWQFSPEDYTLYFLENRVWYPLEQYRHPTRGRTPLTLAPGESRELSFEYDGKYAYVCNNMLVGLEPGEYRLVLPVYPAGETEPQWLAAQFAVQKDGTVRYSGEELELNAVLRDYARRLGEAYVHPEGLEKRPGTTVGQADPYVQGWRIRPDPGGYAVTVYRDRDLERARALLADFENVTVVRGEDGSTAASMVKTDNLGTRGALSAEPAQQTDPRLLRESLWVLTFRWDGEGPLRLSSWALYPERRTDSGWRALPEGNGAFTGDWTFEGCGPSFTLEPGDNLLEINLGWFHTEFGPGGEYRFVLAIPGPEGILEYYVCPFTLTGEGEA